jgi:Tfp pilus assembly protein PilZ
MNATNPDAQKHALLIEIFDLIDSLPESKKKGLLERLSAKKMDSILYKLVLELHRSEWSGLLEDLREMVLGKRKYPRKSCTMVTDYVVNSRAYKNFVKDISISGVFVITNQEFEIGYEMVLSFSLSDKQIPFKFAGEIVRIGNDGVGIRFKNLSQYQKDILQSILKSLA